MASTAYTEQDKARVYVVLTANEGVVKRTARETQVAESTVRRWRDEWETNGPPSLENVEQAVGDFVEEATDLRRLGLTALRGKLELLIQNPKDVNVAQVTTLVGILTDKLDRARGLDVKRVEHEHRILGANEIRELFAGYANGMSLLAAQREEEIIEAEVVEQPELLERN